MNTRGFKQICFLFILTAILMIATFVGAQNISYAQVANPTLTASVEAPLTEPALDGSVVTLTLNGGTYARSIFDIRDAVSVSGIEGVTIPWHDPDKNSDTQITMELEFDGNINADATLTFTVGADAIADYDGTALTAQLPVTGVQESVVASTAAPLTEATLDGSVVTLTLSGRRFASWESDIRNALTVSGIAGVTYDSWDVDRVSDTKVTIELTFSGNIDVDSTLMITVGADAIANYNKGFSLEFPVTAVEETLEASTESSLSEPALDGGIVTLTLNGRTYARWISDIRGAVTVSGIAGVTISEHHKKSDTQITVELEFDGNIDADSTLTFTVGADAIANYNGPALTAARVSVTARSEEYIRGPWLWMIARGSNIESDQLASVSNGAITENHVATQGVNEGDTVGALQWTRGRIPLTPPVCEETKVGIFTFRRCSTDNINKLVNDIGLSQNRDIDHHSAYALINIFSPRDQNDVQMGVGSDDTVKVWLNGEIVHKFIAGGSITINGVTTRTGRSTTGIQDKFYTNLKAGNNLLLVKVSEFTGEWGMFFEIYLGDKDFTTSIPENISQPPDIVENVKAVISASATPALTEATLDEGVVTLTLTDATYEQDIAKIRDAVSVSGIDGVTIDTATLQRLSDTEVTVELDYDLTDFDETAMLTFSVASGALVNYMGDAFTTEISVGATKEVVSASVVSPLTEATLDGSIVTLLLTAAAFEQDISKIREAVTVSGINGVTLDTTTLQRINNRKVTVELKFDGTDLAADTSLLFNVADGAITNHNGTLTAEILVTANTSQALLAMYWVDNWNNNIRRANLDGSNVEDLVTGLDEPQHIALDVSGGKMYWTEGHNIRCANLDGSNIEDLVTGLDKPEGIALDVSGGKMYWTDFGTDKIQRANLGGSNVEDLVTRGQGLESPSGIALDVSGGKMYWTDVGTDKIQRANLDGSNVEDLVTREQGYGGPDDITLDVSGGKVYWIDWDKIQRANLDGSNIEDLVTREHERWFTPEGIALDITGGKMYWTNWVNSGGGKIQRANLDGSNIEDLVTREQGLKDIEGIAIGLIPSVNPTPITKEDVNRDGVVDLNDLVIISLRYGQTGNNPADVNGDKVVNVDDLILVAAAIDEAAAAAAPAARAQMHSHFTKSQLQGWLTEARASGNTSRTYQRGIAVVEQLLALFAPVETALLANYPNPFNPETWIPYQLSKSAEVTLTIYAVDGAVVRTLSLGHQAAGEYQNRSRAAYWDGRNEVGEPVASGLYFYTLTAGDFSATRKMLIRK